jgi:hypothetical protein
MPYDIEKDKFIIFNDGTFYLNNTVFAKLPSPDRGIQQAFNWTVFEGVLMYVYGDKFYAHFLSSEQPFQRELTGYVPQKVSYYDIVATKESIFILSLTPQDSQKMHKARVLRVEPAYEYKDRSIVSGTPYPYEFEDRIINGKIEFEREVYDIIKFSSDVFILNVKR